MESEVVKVNNDKEGSSSPSMAGYDPNRIPASVFSTKSGTEWSAASNESLFSIQMGNNSFSNDYVIMYGKSGDFDPQLKSEELARLDEWSNNNRRCKSSELSSLPPLMEQEEGLQSGESSCHVNKKQGSSSSSHSSPHINQSPAAAYRPPVSPTLNPRISDVSGHSNRSFAFPVLVNDCGKKEESIKIAAEKTESRPLEAQAEAQAQQHVQVQAQKTNRWFSCFSCSWPRCC